jgi:hypothetical protein
MGILRNRVHDELVVQALVSPIMEESLRGQDTPQRLFVHLIVDTGSKHSSLTPAVLGRLGCPPGRPVRVQTHVGEGVTNYYAVRLEFPFSTLTPLPEVRVVALEMPIVFANYYAGVVGRDALRRWATLYNGPRRRLTVRDRPSLWGWLFS